MANTQRTTTDTTKETRCETPPHQESACCANERNLFGVSHCVCAFVVARTARDFALRGLCRNTAAPPECHDTKDLRLSAHSGTSDTKRGEHTHSHTHKSHYGIMLERRHVNGSRERSIRLFDTNATCHIRQVKKTPHTHTAFDVCRISAPKPENRVPNALRNTGNTSACSIQTPARIAMLSYDAAAVSPYYTKANVMHKTNTLYAHVQCTSNVAVAAGVAMGLVGACAL